MHQTSLYVHDRNSGIRIYWNLPQFCSEAVLERWLRARATREKELKIVPDHGRRGKGRGGGREGNDTGEGELHFGFKMAMRLVPGKDRNK